MNKVNSSKSARLNLSEIKTSLDRLALELLRGKFPNVNVEPYYRMSEAYIDETLRHDKQYKHNMKSDNPLETLILLSMDRVASAYVLISGKRDKRDMEGLLRDYETMVRDYLESMRLLI